MKKRFIIIISLWFIITNMFLSSVYAANICKLEGKSSKNDIVKGEEFNVNVSLTEINEGVAGVSYTVEYDENVLEFVGQTVANDWEVTKLETYCSYTTKSYEATTVTGTLTDLKFKAKENAKQGNTTISLNSIDIVKDDDMTENLNNISINVNIVEPSSTPEDKGNEGDNTPSGTETKNDDNKGNEEDNTPSGTETKNDDNKGNEGDNTPSGTETKNDDNKGNEGDNTPSGTEAKNEDKGNNGDNKPSEQIDEKKADTKLPYTGAKRGIILSLIGISLIIIVLSYLKLFKYKGI